MSKKSLVTIIEKEADLMGAPTPSDNEGRSFGEHWMLGLGAVRLSHMGVGLYWAQILSRWKSGLVIPYAEGALPRWVNREAHRRTDKSHSGKRRERSPSKSQRVRQRQDGLAAVYHHRWLTSGS